MLRNMQGKYAYGMCIGFFLGFFVIHPISVVFEAVFIPQVTISARNIVYAFHPHHIPMGIFFGFFGMSLGGLNIYYLRKINTEKKRINLLEGLLPICSYCKKIRDDSTALDGEGEWERIEDYIYRKTDQEFTHGICPDCVEKAFPGVGRDRPGNMIVLKDVI